MDVSDLDDLAAIVRTHVDQSAPRPVAAGTRVGAALIDAFALVFLNGFLTICAIAIDRTVRGPWGEVIPVMAFWAANTAYTATEVVLRATPGKWLLGLSITTPAGARPPLHRLLFRWLIKFSFMILAGIALALTLAMFMSDGDDELLDVPLMIVGLAFYPSLGLSLVSSLGVFFPRRLALHDWLTGTAVMSDLELTRRGRTAAPRAFEVRPVGGVATSPPAPEAAPVVNDATQAPSDPTPRSE